jgi:hypothetical protein
MLSLAATALAASLVVGQAQGQAPTPETLKEYGEAVVGDWKGKVELVHDMPGVGKAGDTVDATGSIRWILRKSALEGRWKAGTNSGRWIVVWDPAEKVIRTLGGNTNGEAGQSVIRKQDGKWVTEQCSMSADGKKLTFTATLTISDDGKTHTYQGVNNMLDGKKLSDWTDVWKREKLEANADTAKAPDIAGSYPLVSINGKALPFTVTHEGPGIKVTSGTFTIRPDGTCTSVTAFVTPSGQAEKREVSATYTRDGSKLTMQWQGAGRTTGILKGNTFTMENEGQLLLYRKTR